MSPSPCADDLQYRHEGQAVFRDGISNTGWDRSLLPPQQDTVSDQFVEMTDEHALSDLRDAAPQFACTHRTLGEAPQDGSLPAAVDDRQHGIDGTSGTF